MTLDVIGMICPSKKAIMCRVLKDLVRKGICFYPVKARQNLWPPLSTLRIRTDNEMDKVGGQAGRQGRRGSEGGRERVSYLTERSNDRFYGQAAWRDSGAGYLSDWPNSRSFVNGTRRSRLQRRCALKFKSNMISAVCQFLLISHKMF